MLNHEHEHTLDRRPTAHAGEPHESPVVDVTTADRPSEQPVEQPASIIEATATGSGAAQPDESPDVFAHAADPDIDGLPNPTTHSAAAPHPRSLKRRLEEQHESGRKARVRSQPLGVSAPKRVREPVVVDWEPEPMTGPWRAKPYIVALALLAWITAAGVLATDVVQLEQRGLQPRLLVPLTWALAAAVTFIPIQLRLAIPGVGWQSMVGFGLLGYLLAFTPAPTGWLLDLPDLPVYLLLFFALFYTVTAMVVPLTYLLGQRWYKLRIHRMDVGRARRQAYEIGLLLVVTLALASLRVLSPVTFGLLALVIVLTEALLLSQVQPEG